MRKAMTFGCPKSLNSPKALHSSALVVVGALIHDQTVFSMPHYRLGQFCPVPVLKG